MSDFLPFERDEATRQFERRREEIRRSLWIPVLAEAIPQLQEAQTEVLLAARTELFHGLAYDPEISLEDKKHDADALHEELVRRGYYRR